MHARIKFFIILIASCSYQLLPQDDQPNFHQQLNTAILKNVKVENPSEQDQTLINIAKAFHDFGTPLELLYPENWHAFQSVDFFSILAKHNHTQTASGYRMLQQQCSAGMTDEIAILKSRQERIQFLHQNPELVENLSNILNRSIDAEQKFLQLFKEVDQSARNLYFSSQWLSSLNENSTVMEATTRLASTLPLTLHIFDWILPAIFTNFIEEQRTNNNFVVFKAFHNKDYSTVDKSKILITALGKATYNTLTNPTEIPKKQVNFWKTAYGTSENVALGIVTVLTAIKIYHLYTVAKNAKELFDIIYEKQQDLIAISHLIKSLQVIERTLEKNEQLASVMPSEYAKLAKLFDQKNKQTSADLKNLIKDLLSSSFQGTDSYLFSQQGKILATHHALVRIKGELIPYLEAFGQIDAYLATVKLYEQFKDHDNAKFCFPEYITHETPIFVAENFWHPLIDAHKVVCNNLNMGNQNAHANLIITGPNAGGKTTALTASIINIIFAQTLGIAPSTTLQITPFAKIHSSLDITTNLAEGLSLFAAEVDRAKKLKKSILSCNPEQKTFTIVDELFTGTAESVAANIGFQFATMLGNMKQSMMIITTHIKHLTKLETETDCFTNYKVADATIDETGKITYPFKLVKGISDQNIAEQMMQQEGIF